MFKSYFSTIFDAAHFFELFFLSAGWTLFENRPWQGAPSLARTARDLICLLAAFFLCDAFLTYDNLTDYLWRWVLAEGGISAVYVFLHQNERSLAGFALWCSMYAGSISLTAMGGQASIILSHYSFPGAWQGFIRVIFNALTVLLALYLSARRLDKYERIPPGGLVMILTGDLCLFLIRWLEGRWFLFYYYYAILLAAAYFCVLVLVLDAVYAVDSICREQTRSMELLAEKRRVESERELVRLSEKQLEDLHQLKHDIKNQYAYMRILLAERRYDELESYFQQRDGELTELSAPLNCGNRCVSIVLNMERQKADAAGVALNTKLVVPPVLPFPDSDLCSLLANLIDNAIEECVRLGEYFPKVRQQGVSVSINPGNPGSDYLYIEVRNPTDRKKLDHGRGGLVSTKRDAEVHGYGTRIITRLAEKYNGSVLFDTADGQFTARVILDMMAAKEVEAP